MQRVGVTIEIVTSILQQLQLLTEMALLGTGIGPWSLFSPLEMRALRAAFILRHRLTRSAGVKRGFLDSFAGQGCQEALLAEGQCRTPYAC